MMFFQALLIIIGLFWVFGVLGRLKKDFLELKGDTVQANKSVILFIWALTVVVAIGTIWLIQQWAEPLVELVKGFVQ